VKPTRFIVSPNRNGPPASASVNIHHGDFAELKIDMSWTKFTTFKVQLERVDQGRVAIIDGLTKDSNGHVRISLNAGAFGPGEYLVTIEGLNMRRESLPMGWFKIAVAR